MKKLMIALGATTLTLTACSAGKTDFKKTAESVIVKEWKKQLGTDIKATCEEPTSTAVGTKFSCTGTTDDGQEAQFEAEITKKDEVTVNQV